MLHPTEGGFVRDLSSSIARGAYAVNRSWSCGVNFLLRTNSYKMTHWQQYPPRLTGSFSYMESRGGRFEETVFFGLQYYLKEYLQNRVFTLDDVREAEGICRDHFQSSVFNAASWASLYKKYGGRLPVIIRAVPEGSVIPVRNAMLTIESTDSEFAWIPNYLETLLFKIWYPCTVATFARETRKIFIKYLERTGDPNLTREMLHDFGSRGATSEESNAIGGAAHLLSFDRTDSLAGVLLLRNHYAANRSIGSSIPASEHSTITSWGRECELDAYKNFLETYPSGEISCVSDSYNIFDACDVMWGDKLRDIVQRRDGTLFIRPDSGDPKQVMAAIMEILASRFGCSINKKGYRVLPPYVRVMQGDGINIKSISEILEHLTGKLGWSADNFRFGIGGASLRGLSRDTQQFGLKCSAVKVGDRWIPVCKDPITARPKVSKPGRLALLRNQDGGLYTLQHLQEEEIEGDLLEVVFSNGDIHRDCNLDEVRERQC